MIISHAAIRRPVTVVMVFIGLAIIGMFSAFRLPVEEFPDSEKPNVSIAIDHSATTTQELERTITRPVEEILSTMSGIEDIRSFTRPGAVRFSLDLDQDSDVTSKGIEAKDLIESIRHILPEDLGRIRLRQRDPNTTPIMNVQIVVEDLNMDSAYDLLDVHVRTELERLPGVNSVSLYGIVKDYIRILLDENRVAASGMDMREIQSRLRQANFYLFAGTFETERTEYRVRPLGRYESLDSIRQLPINDRGLVLDDVADVVLMPDDEVERRRVNGVKALGVSVYKRPEANLVEVIRSLEVAMDRIKEKPIFKDIQFFSLDSQGDRVVESLNDLRDSGFIGGVLSMIVLFLFLRQFNVSLLIASTVPLALCATLGMMYFLDMTLNILSLVGLMLTIGLLVDNSVVVSEAIAIRRRDPGATPREAADRGVSEVGLAITAGTLTTVIVFLPSLFTDDQQTSVMLQNIATPLCTALLGSLLVAQTLVPSMLARIPVPIHERRHTVIDRMGEYYEQVVRFTLRHRLFSVLVAAAIAASGWYAYQQLEVDMNPEQESERLELGYYIRGTMEIEYMEQFVGRVEDYLIANKERFEIENFFTEYDTDRGNTIINLVKDGTLSPRVVKDLIMEDIPELPKIRLRFRNDRRGYGGGFRGRGGLGLRITGDSTEELQHIADDIVSVLEIHPMLTDVQHDGESNREELRISLRQELAGKLGVNATMVAQSVSIALGGRGMRRGFVEDGRETDIYLELEGSEDANISTVRNLPIALPGGDSVPLQTIAEIYFDSSVRVVIRENRQTSINVNFGTRGAPPLVAQTIVENIMKKYDLPPGYRWELGQQFKGDQDTFNEMVFTAVIAVVLVYMLMAALFESVLFPTTVIIAIAFSLVGACWSLMLTGTTLTSMALTGMLLLAGLVVNNGIVLLNRIIQMRADGEDRMTAIVESGKHRLRPILMTVCTTTAGMLPLAIGEVRVGGGGPAYFPMARTLIGGLAFSTVITLLILPLIYVLFDDMKNASVRFWRESVRRAAKTPG